MACVNVDAVSWYVMQLVAVTPSAPAPSASGPPIDPNRITPGFLGFIAFVVLSVACVGIYFSMRKQLRRVNFEEDAPEAGARSVEVFPRRSSTPRGIDLTDKKNGIQASGGNEMRSAGPAGPEVPGSTRGTEDPPFSAG